MQLSPISLAITRLGGVRFSPASLFPVGTAGVWYDPSDASTLFEDTAGTTPSPTPGAGALSVVGLMLDKSQGLVLGPELITNGDFSQGSTGWTLEAGWSVGSGVATSTGGSATIYQVSNAIIGNFTKVTFTIVSRSGDTAIRVRCGNGFISSSFTTPGTYSVTVASPNTGLMGFYGDGTTGSISIDNISFRLLPGNHAISYNTTTARPVLSARVNLLNATATLSTQSVTTQATNYTLYFTGSGSITLSGTATGTFNAGSNTVTCTAGTLTLTVSGSVTTADLRPANIGTSVPSYQAVTSTYTYDSSGFPRYLVFNGTASGMYTPANLNLSGTDKATVFAGVRKLSDAALGVVAEFSAGIATNNGSFLLSAPNSAAANYNFSSKGTTQVDNTVTTYTAPISNVVTGQGNISAPSNVIRVNGTQAGSVVTTQGTGNYGTFALNLGARNAQSGTPTVGTFFNGYLYSAIVVGAASTAAQISSTESWINVKEGTVY